MNALKRQMIVMTMQIVLILLVRSLVHVKQDILEMGNHVQILMNALKRQTIVMTMQIVLILLVRSLVHVKQDILEMGNHVQIDECTKKTDNCDDNADCTNTVGSFTCACKAGYSGDGKSCTDIDECTKKTDD